MTTALTPIQLIDALLKSGLSEKDIADKVPTSQPSINRIYAGVTKKPNFEIVDRLRVLVSELPPVDDPDLNHENGEAAA